MAPEPPYEPILHQAERQGCRSDEGGLAEGQKASDKSIHQGEASGASTEETFSKMGLIYWLAVERVVRENLTIQMVLLVFKGEWYYCKALRL